MQKTDDGAEVLRLLFENELAEQAAVDALAVRDRNCTRREIIKRAYLTGHTRAQMMLRWCPQLIGLDDRSPDRVGRLSVLEAKRIEEMFEGVLDGTKKRRG